VGTVLAVAQDSNSTAVYYDIVHPACVTRRQDTALHTAAGKWAEIGEMMFVRHHTSSLTNFGTVTSRVWIRVSTHRMVAEKGERPSFVNRNEPVIDALEVGACPLSHIWGRTCTEEGAVP